VAGVGSMARARGAALVDLNADGRLDLLVVNRRAPMAVWQNATPDTGHWLALDLAAPGANSRAIGAFAEVRLPDGQVLTQENTVGGGHVSGQMVPLHFGLGQAAMVEVRVIWPGGMASDWTPVAADRTVRIRPGADGQLDVSKEP